MVESEKRLSRAANGVPFSPRAPVGAPSLSRSLRLSTAQMPFSAFWPNHSDRYAAATKKYDEAPFPTTRQSNAKMFAAQKPPTASTTAQPAGRNASLLTHRAKQTAMAAPLTTAPTILTQGMSPRYRSSSPTARQVARTHPAREPTKRRRRRDATKAIEAAHSAIRLAINRTSAPVPGPGNAKTSAFMRPVAIDHSRPRPAQKGGLRDTRRHPSPSRSPGPLPERLPAIIKGLVAGNPFTNPSF